MNAMTRIDSMTLIDVIFYENTYVYSNSSKEQMNGTSNSPNVFILSPEPQLSPSPSNEHNIPDNSPIWNLNNPSVKLLDKIISEAS